MGLHAQGGRRARCRVERLDGLERRRSRDAASQPPASGPAARGQTTTRRHGFGDKPKSQEGLRGGRGCRSGGIDHADDLVDGARLDRGRRRSSAAARRSGRDASRRRSRRSPGSCSSRGRLRVRAVISTQPSVTMPAKSSRSRPMLRSIWSSAVELKVPALVLSTMISSPRRRHHLEEFEVEGVAGRAPSTSRASDRCPSRWSSVRYLTRTWISSMPAARQASCSRRTRGRISSTKSQRSCSSQGLPCSLASRPIRPSGWAQPCCRSMMISAVGEGRRAVPWARGRAGSRDRRPWRDPLFTGG